MKVYLGLDDWNTKNINMQIWRALRELQREYPDFKINMFVSGGLPKKTRERWMRYCLHGWYHTPNEMVAWTHIVKWGFSKIYKAPYWQLPDYFYKDLRDHGWQIMLNPEVEDPREGIRFNWNIKNEPDLTQDVLIGHGHVQNVCDNGLLESLDRIKMLPKDTEFCFLEDYYGR